jgi:hypothetical protein
VTGDDTFVLTAISAWVVVILLGSCSSSKLFRIASMLDLISIISRCCDLRICWRLSSAASAGIRTLSVPTQAHNIGRNVPRSQSGSNRLISSAGSKCLYLSISPVFARTSRTRCHLASESVCRLMFCSKGTTKADGYMPATSLTSKSKGYLV